VIACGDFNDTPASFAYHQLVDGLNDTFLEAGWGLGPTYSGIFKNYRIDYIFTGNDFEVRNYRTICVDYSDHRPVTSEVRMK
jgi:endonuclease/exonuclease/phosphatase family metal-dependent hydrolase